VNRGRLKRVAAAGIDTLLCLAIGAAACTGGEAPVGGRAKTGSPAPAAPPTRPSSLGPLGAPGCKPMSPIRPVRGNDFRTGFPEVQGTGRDAQLWGMLMPQHPYPPLLAGEDVKIVWRMTGSGDLRLTATGPDGKPGRLTFGPEPHGGSDYTRPGEEWGAGYHFTKAGCWHLRATRGSAVADVWLSVRRA
jgi:hypothetical protein